MKIADLFVDLKLDSASFCRDLATTLTKASASASPSRSMPTPRSRRRRSRRSPAARWSSTSTPTRRRPTLTIDRPRGTATSKIDVEVEGTEGHQLRLQGRVQPEHGDRGSRRVRDPRALGAHRGAGTLGSALLTAGGAGGVFAGAVALQVKSMKQAQTDIQTTEKSLGNLTKGTKEYNDKAAKLTAQQRAFNQEFGPAAKGFDNATTGISKFQQATSKVTLGVMSQGLNLFADVLPRLAPLANAAGRAVAGC